MKNKKVSFSKSKSNNSNEDVDSPVSHSSTTASLKPAIRGQSVRTFVVSVPIGSESPKITAGHIHELNHHDTINDIAENIDKVESIVNNIQVISISCFDFFRSCRNKVDVKDNGIDMKGNKADVKGTVV
jgi:hypothetical protein